MYFFTYFHPHSLFIFASLIDTNLYLLLIYIWYYAYRPPLLAAAHVDDNTSSVFFNWTQVAYLYLSIIIILVLCNYTIYFNYLSQHLPAILEIFTLVLFP